MKIGIIVFSQTGNTYSVAKKLSDKLNDLGKTADLERLKVVGEYHPGVKDVNFEKQPNLEKYDSLIFASPVQAFSLSTAMKRYLSNILSIKNKKVACFVTQAFPYPWMGGNNAIRQMKKICELKGAAVVGSGIINWSNKKRDQRIIEVVDSLSRLF